MADPFSALIGLMPGAVEEVSEFLKSGHGESLKRLDRVGKLIEGFETPYGMELLATVHWVAREQKPDATEEEIIQAVQAWSQRKADRFTGNHIRKALKHLKDRSWL